MNTNRDCAGFCRDCGREHALPAEPALRHAQELMVVLDPGRDQHFAPFSIKSQQGSGDPKMQQTKKGNQWSFGMKGLRPTMHPLQHGMIVPLYSSR